MRLMHIQSMVTPDGLRWLSVLTALVLACGGCGTASQAVDGGSTDSAVADSGADDASTNGHEFRPLVDARPYAVQLPSTYDPEVPTPLILSLHGFTLDGITTVAQARLSTLAASKGYLLAFPDGTPDTMGRRFWNAGGCCNVDGIEVDDVTYLMEVLDDLESRYSIDRRRVFVFGFSNGGFMAHRLACEHGDRIAAIVSLGGVSWLDPSDCPAGHLVNVLQLHSNADEVIPFGGTQYLPSAAATVAMWMDKNGCTGALTTGGSLDIDRTVAGAETTIQTAEGCPAGGAVQFFTLDGSAHGPNLGGDWLTTIGDFFEEHPKP